MDSVTMWALVGAAGVYFAFLGLTAAPAIPLKAPGQTSFPANLVAQLQARLDAAELPVSANQFLMFCVIAAGAAAFVASIFGTPALTLAGVVIAPLLIWQRYEDQRDDFRQKYDESLAEVAQLLREGFSATSTVRGALDHAARNGPDPAAADLREVWSSHQLGAELANAFAPVVERRRNPHLRMIAEALSLKATEGGNIREVVEGLETMVREQVNLRREIAAKQALARIESIIVCLAPVGIFILMQVTPSLRMYEGSFYQEGQGEIILTLSMIGSAVAFFLARYLATRGLTLEVKEA